MRNYALVEELLRKDLVHLLPNTYDPVTFSTAQADAEGWTGQQVAIALQLGAFYKKLAPEGQTESAVTACLEKFRSLNASIKFDLPNERDSESMAYMLSLFKNAVYEVLDFEPDGQNFDLSWIVDHFAAGPGASRMANSRNFYTKLFDSNHSYTNPHVLALFRAATSHSETWTSAITAWEKDFRPVVVSGNSLFTVKKNREISRTCCTEPLLNMLMQKALGAWLEMRLVKKLGINLANQPDINRKLTQYGSETGYFGTLDLSSASDSISTTLCEWMLPRPVMGFIRSFRSEIVRYPDGHEEELRMVGTMGNGFTFPLETIIFACAVNAVYASKGITPRYRGKLPVNAAVFGDDLVVRDDCFAAVELLLKRLGFVVNVSKSFNQGSFRESCGYDYWKGSNIRPVYIESLETSQDVYSSFNRLARWSAVNDVPIPTVLQYLATLARYMPIPFSWMDDAGFKVPSRLAPEIRNDRGWVKFYYIDPETTAERVPRDPQEARRLGYKGFNPSGWEVCFLGGYAHNPVKGADDAFLTANALDTRRSREEADLINRRPFQGEVLRRRRRTGSIPYWDWFGAEDTGRFPTSVFSSWVAGVARIF